MSQQQEYENYDFHYADPEPSSLAKRKFIRRKLEDRMDRRRLMEEIDELNGEFDWGESEK